MNDQSYPLASPTAILIINPLANIIYSSYTPLYILDSATAVFRIMGIRFKLYEQN
jgi:hypothetical protein